MIPETFTIASIARLLLCSFSILVLPAAVQGSAGDRDSAFRRCTNNCESTGCIRLQAGTQLINSSCDAACPSNREPVPFHLKMMQWSCVDDCRYRCMDQRKLHTIDGLDGGKCKYFGKWPFKRILGLQELLSVMFSLANLAAHARNLYKLRLMQHATQHLDIHMSKGGPVWGLWIGYALGSINAWWWSAVFHSRDTYVTERLDYLSADLSIMIGLYVSIVRIFGVARLQSRLLCAVPLILVTAIHFHHMLFVRFDYGFNVMLCIVAGVLQQVMWCTWAMHNRHPCRKQLFTFVLLINAALSLEVLDFPPVGGYLDAHALWHLCTVPLIYLWYKFVFADIKWAAMAAEASWTPPDKQL